jgi:hypothetical protein
MDNVQPLMHVFAVMFGSGNNLWVLTVGNVSSLQVSSGKGSPSKSYSSSSSTSTENVVSTLESKIKGKVSSVIRISITCTCGY